MERLHGWRFPRFAATVGDQLLGIADTIVIGSLGSDALAAITGAATVFITIVLTLHGLSQGAGILAAQAIGAGDRERFGRITRASLLVPVVLGSAIAVAAIWLSAPLMLALIGPLPTEHAGACYLHRVLGAAFLLLRLQDAASPP